MEGTAGSVSSSARILVIDDEALVTTALVRMLQADGYEAVSAACGVEAIERARQCDFDLAITDLLMPGMDGLETMAALKGLDPQIAVIVLTGHAAVESSVAALKQGACDYLLKPLDFGQLRTAVSRALEIRQLNATLSMYQTRRETLATLDPQELLPAVMKFAESGMRAEAAGLAIQAADNEPWQVHVSQSGLPISESEVTNLAMQALRARKALRDPSSEDSGDQRPPGSILAYPLEMHGKPLGGLVLWRGPGSRSFTSLDLQIGKALAAEVAVALDHARVYGELSRRIEELESARADTARAETNARRIIQTAGEGIVLFDLHGIIWGYNPAAAEMFGWPRESMVTRNLLEVGIPARLRDEFQQQWNSPDGEEGRKIFETCALRQNGEEIPLEASITAIQTPQGHLLSMFARDISERRRAEQALRESEAKLQAIFNNVETAILMIDPQTHRITEANPAAVQMVGAERERVVGSVCHKFVCPAEKGKCPVSDLGQTVDNSERILLTASGERREIIKTVTAVTLDGRTQLLESIVDISGRKRAERALEERTAYLDTLIETSPLGIVVLDLQGHIQLSNVAFERIFLYSRGEMRGAILDDLIVPDNLRDESADCDRRCREGGSISIVSRRRRKDGSFVDVEISGEPLVINGAMQGILALYHNITERKQMEAALRLAQFSVEHASDAISWVDVSGRIVYANDAVCRMVGYSHDELLALTIPDINPDIPADQWPATWEKIKAQGSLSFESHRRSKQGRVFPVEVTANYVQFSGKEYNFTFARDITERKRAEQALRESEQRYRSLFENNQAGVFRTAMDGRVLDCNPAMARIMGFGSPEEVLTRSVLDFYFSERERNEFIERLGVTGRLSNYEMRLRRKDGSAIWLMANVFSSAAIAGKPQIIEGALVDITERKRAEEALRESEARFRRLTESNIFGIFVADDRGLIVEANAAFLEMLSYDEEDLRQGKVRWDRLAPAELAHVHVGIAQQLRTSGVSLPAEVEYFRKDGGRLPILISLVALDASASRALGFVLDLTGQKRAEEQTRIQSAALESAANGVVIADRKGQIVWVNPAFTRLTGYAPSEAIGQSPRVLKSGAHDSAFYQQLWNTILSGQVWQGEISNRRKNGTLYTEEMTITPVRNARGEITHFIAVKQDISERKRAEEEIAFKTALLEAQSETTMDGILAVDGLGRVLLSNRRFAEMCSIPDALLESRDDKKMLDAVLVQLKYPDEFLARVKYLYAHPAEKSHDEIELRDGRIFDRYSSPLQVANGKCYGRIWYFRDITESKRAEAALLASEQRYRLLFSQMLVGFVLFEVVYDENGSPIDHRYLEMNSAFERHTGLARDQVMGKTIREILPGIEPFWIETYGKVATTGESTHFEAYAHPLQRWFDVTAFRLQPGQVAVTFADVTARKRAEEQTRLQTAALESAVNGIAVTDRDGHVLWVNPAFTHLTGYEAEEILGETMRLLKSGRQDGHFYGDLWQTILSGGAWHGELVNRRKDGTEYFDETTITPVRDAAGVVTHFVAIKLDVTARKEAEAELRRYAQDLERAHDAQEKHAAELAHLVEDLAQERDLLQTLMNNIPDAIYFKDRECRFTRVNTAQAEFLGLESPSAALGKTDFDFFPQAEARAFNADEKKIVETGQPLIGHMERLTDAKGKQHWISNTEVPVKDAQGGVTGIVGVARDVSEWRAASEALRQSEERYRELFENASDIVFTTELDGRMTSLNRIGRQLLGYSAQEVASLKFFSLVRPEFGDQLKADLKSLLAGETNIRRELEVTAKDGHRVRLEAQPRLILKDGAPVGVQGIARDITGRDVAEMELRHAQKLESVGRLASGIAHEINTPIQFVGDNTRFLQDSFGGLQTLITKYQELRDAAGQGAAPPELLADVQRTEESSDASYLLEEIPKALSQTLEGVTRVATIVRAMKEFAHPESKEMAAADLNKSLQSTLTVARNELKYVADVETDFGELPPVICSVGDMNQVFLNLLVNAAHAIGDVVKDTGAKGKIRVSTRAESDMVHIAIADTGGGIPEAIRNRIFDPFFTTKEVGRGTGQGLSIARSVVVERHKGTLTFDSEVGKGTTFHIRLPISPPENTKETKTS